MQVEIMQAEPVLTNTPSNRNLLESDSKTYEVRGETYGLNNGIVLYHYTFSPYAKRVVWYLTLRGIDYAECKQPHMLPRPDIALLDVHYRRIPIMAIGRDVYCDTRIQLRKLEQLFPGSALSPTSPEAATLQKLFEIWAIEGGLFARASQLIPSEMPLLKDVKFQKDREDFSGRPWTKENIDKNRPEALVMARKGFVLLEGLMNDGREWVQKTREPTLADIEAIFIFDWAIGLKGALPKEVISPQEFPSVFAYIERWNKAIKDAKTKAPKPTSLKGQEAAKRILDADFADKEIGVSATDPLGLKKGQEVEVWASDMASGPKYRDRGSLIGLDDEEVVISVSTGTAGKDIRLHCPRSGFRVAPASSGAKL